MSQEGKEGVVPKDNLLNRPLVKKGVWGRQFWHDVVYGRTLSMDTGTRQQLSIDGRLTFMLNGFNYVAPLHPALYSNTLFCTMEPKSTQQLTGSGQTTGRIFQLPFFSSRLGWHILPDPKWPFSGTGTPTGYPRGSLLPQIWPKMGYINHAKYVNLNVRNYFSFFLAGEWFWGNNQPQIIKPCHNSGFWGCLKPNYFKKQDSTSSLFLT